MISIENTFANYEQARLDFVKNLAKYADTTDCIEIFQAAQTVMLLKPLLTDPNPDVQAQSSQTLLRLTDASEELANEVIQDGVLPSLVSLLEHGTISNQICAAKELKSLTNYNMPQTQLVVNSGALDQLAHHCSDSDAKLAEICILAIRNIASFHADLAQEVVDTNCLQSIVDQLGAPESSLKCAALSALIEIVKHTTELAQVVADTHCLNIIATLTGSTNSTVRRLACESLAHFSKHTADLAEQVIEADAFPRLLYCLRDLDPNVRLHAVTCVREIAKHSKEFCQTIVNNGALTALTCYIRDTDGIDRLPAVVTIGFSAAYSEVLAAAACSTPNLLAVLVQCVMGEGDERVKGAAAWTLGQLGRHSSAHAEQVVREGALTSLVAVAIHTASAPSLVEKCTSAAKEIIAVCLHMKSLEPLLLSPDTPVDILAVVLVQYQKKIRTELLSRRRQQARRKKQDEEEKIAAANPHNHRKKASVAAARAALYPTTVGQDGGRRGGGRERDGSGGISAAARTTASSSAESDAPFLSFADVYDQIMARLNQPSLFEQFARIGGLERIQEAIKQHGPLPELKGPIDEILSYYPEDVVRQTNPDYQQDLLRKIENFHT